jgi:hypothetical protein
MVEMQDDCAAVVLWRATDVYIHNAYILHTCIAYGFDVRRGGAVGWGYSHVGNFVSPSGKALAGPDGIWFCLRSL